MIMTELPEAAPAVEADTRRSRKVLRSTARENQVTRKSAGQAATMAKVDSDRRRFRAGGSGHARNRNHGRAHRGAAPNGIDRTQY